jgi:DNA-binding beta-propeller fold protein YncE
VVTLRGPAGGDRLRGSRRTGTIDQYGQPLENSNMKIISLRTGHSSKLPLLACLVCLQLLSPPFAGNVMAVGFPRRPPFHVIDSLAAFSKQPVWRTLAGSPRAAGTNDGPGVSARFSNPSGIAVDAAGTTYVADTDNHFIRKISPAGVVSTLAGQPGIAGYQDGAATNALFSSPRSLALDQDGNLYVAGTGNGLVRRIARREMSLPWKREPLGVATANLFTGF